MMKSIYVILICAIALSISNLSAGDRKGRSQSKKSISSSHQVKSHITKRGTIVKSHKKSNPDKSKWNNYSTKGNINPSTGKKGTKSPFKK